MNRIQALLGVEYPVVQAPMTYIARAVLAAAVSEAGGLGMIETLTDEGRADLHRVRELTDKPVAANLMIQGWKKDPSIVDVLAEAGVRHVFTSAGDPALFTARLHEAGMTVVHVVGSLKGAQKAADAGVDALVVEGVEGGGFKSLLGASTMVLLPLVADRIDLPIIAAGGVCDARSAAAAVVLGAEGVQMGTRMLASRESAVHANFKDAIVARTTRARCCSTFPATRRCACCGRAWPSGWPPTTRTRNCWAGSPSSISMVTSTPASPTPVRYPCRIDGLLPVAEIVRQTWSDIAAALDAARPRSSRCLRAGVTSLSSATRMARSRRTDPGLSKPKGRQMADVNDFDAKNIAEFRANHGRVGGQFEGAPLLVLHTLERAAVGRGPTS